MYGSCFTYCGKVFTNVAYIVLYFPNIFVVSPSYGLLMETGAKVTSCIVKKRGIQFPLFQHPK